MTTTQKEPIMTADIATCQFLSETLFTDTRVWEVVRRTPATIVLRSTRHTDRRRPDMACDEGAYGLRPQIIEVEADPNGYIVTARRRKDGTYRIASGRPLRPVEGLPTAWIDYRM